MRIAVLKNRLLQMTSRMFDERNYGVCSFRELLAQHSYVVRIDGPDVVLIADKAMTGARRRVRPDLWRAVMDYSSAQRYAWDAEQQHARPAEDGDTWIIPTLSREDMDAWRQEFAGRYPDDLEVETWRTRALPTKALPLPLQLPWTEFVRDRTIARLSEWFAANELDVDPLAPERSPNLSNETSTEALKNMVLRCVAVMTAEELAALSLPPAAVLRAFAGGS
jgi:hypothetical protein